ncbi:hypothetical protein [Asticcacaulis sp. 201]|uniref:hypothetical protein n=1 Tax=Asticcacaulis sp. 201 TaxID=3028787 RepID=UPI002916C156|nr:hypothetical protein [Asticcacaulis sp. 201]MDV6330184.1 hypothetical protein [Asticcacaulis sp. 201]
MLFLQGIWHSAKVIGAGLYWLMSLGFLWGGLMQWGKDPLLGQVCVGFVICLFCLRIVLVKRVVTAAVFNVAACLVFFVFVAILQAKGMTGQA